MDSGWHESGCEKVNVIDRPTRNVYTENEVYASAWTAYEAI